MLRKIEKITDAVIIGGGLQGLSIAYHLILKKIRVLVVEKHYLGSGSSMRNLGGIRAQHPTPEEIQLARASQKMWERLSGELRFNVLFRQDGYLFLAYDEKEAEEYYRRVKLQNRFGVQSKYLEPKEIRGLVPFLNMEGIIAGTFFAKDGIAHPFAAIWAFANRLEELGGEVWTHTTVLGVEMRKSSFYVVTDRGAIETKIVVNAAGVASKSIARMVGIDLPTRVLKHQALVTESLKPFLDPLVVTPWVAIAQTLRGEILGTNDELEETDPDDFRSTPSFIRRTAWYMTRIIPRLSHVKVIRQWSGHYDETPDKKPIIGSVRGIEGYFQSVGWRHDGFMMAPIAGKLLAELITERKTPDLLRPFAMDRFRGKDRVKI